VSAREAAMEAIAVVARSLDDLRGEVVFVGGAVAALYTFESEPVDIRPTKDVDCIVEVRTVGDYHQLTLSLRAHNFREDESPDAPRCRFRLGALTVDIMPTKASVLGFSNPWFAEAMQNAEEVELRGVRIRVVTPLYFIATKLVAFRNRGSGDYFASHDLEDAIAVLDAGAPLREAIAHGTKPVHKFIRDELRDHNSRDAFRDSILGHVAGDAVRADRLLDWFAEISKV
jgi:hypothetical protein